MKLSKLNIFNPIENNKEDQLTANEFEVLRSYIRDIFPSESNPKLTNDEINNNKLVNDYLIANTKLQPSKLDLRYNLNNFIHHLHDDAWMAKYIDKLIKKNSQKETHEKAVFENNKEHNRNQFADNLFSNDKKSLFNNKKNSVRLSTIKKFVTTYEEYDKARKSYEEDLTRAQISYMMENNTPNQILPESEIEPYDDPIYAQTGFNYKSYTLNVNADKIFYQCVMQAMNNLGLDKHSTELSLEKNAGIWRKKMMLNAYFSRILNTVENVNDDMKGYDTRKLIFDKYQSKENYWLLLREYEYYQDHKDIIDELGTATETMKATETQVKTWRRMVKKIEQIHLEVNNEHNQSDDLIKDL